MAGYLGASPVPQSIQRRQTFTATAGQTTFNTTGYTDGNFIDVYLNGVKLVGGGTDYTASNGNDIVLATGASAGDVLDFSAINPLTNFLGQVEFADGSSSSPSISNIGDADTGFYFPSSNTIGFSTNGSARGFIETGGVLIGKSSFETFSSGYQGDGIELDVDGNARFTVDDGINLRLDRRSSSGPMIIMMKDGNVIGNMGIADNDNLYIANSDAADVGIKFNGDGNTISPCTATGANRGDAIDLGLSSSKFKDLYLSGGVVFGDAGGSGTSSSNTFDSYEEGTFTPSFTIVGDATGVAYVSREGHYTKIGRMVHIFMRISLSNNGTASGHVHLEGLPFSVGNVMSTTSIQGGVPVTFIGGTIGTSYSVNANPFEGTSTMKLYRQNLTDGTSNIQFTNNQAGNSFDFRLTAHYMTS
tara:strand:- start:577 stop:1824 length:1248 start_codon:yes stop_codon:yes gene_type:complete